MSRKKTPDDDPLFADEDAPKCKRKRKRDMDEGPVRCVATRCSLPAAPDSTYCKVHTLLFDGMRKLRGSSRRAAARGDFKGGALHGLGSLLLDLGGQLFTNAGNQVASAADHAAAQAGPIDWSQLFGQKPTEQSDAAGFATSCWEVLGLDPATSTADDIREMQRKLALIYHTDKHNPAVLSNKIAEINAAAAEALRQRK